jgi:hypothetical protein
MNALPTRLARWIPPRYRRVVGTFALLFSAWVGIYGHLWSFERLDEHRFTAKAILSGTLKLRSAVSLIQNDEQVYNGAAYTNWGFGVPLLQAPFHALATAMRLLHGFFPDRAIYFFYAAAMIPILWAAFARLVVDATPPESSPADRALLSWAATWLALVLALFPLTSTRFVIYEETLAYFVVFELLVLSGYVFARRSWRYAPVIGMGLASGMGLLIRPTGLLYAVLWGFVVAMEGRARKCLAFLGALAPFGAFWLYSNRVRSGSYVGLGFPNSTPAWVYNMPIERFGSQCSDTPAHVLSGALRLFTGFFIFVTRSASTPWLRRCHFDFEERGGVLPFFWPLVLPVVGWMFYKLPTRRERRIANYAPHALMAILFVMFVRRGMGFAWRYAADFWPAILLACVQSVAARPAALTRAPAALLAKVMCGYGLFVFLTLLFPAPVPEIVPSSETAAMLRRFEGSRWGKDDPLPSTLSCGDSLAPIFQNGLGWKAGCTVDTFTNVLLAVTPKEGDHYQIRARTEGMTASTVRVYVNGTIYTARKVNNSYDADVSVPYAALGSPVVVVTVEWTRGFDPPSGKLLSIALV